MNIYTRRQLLRTTLLGAGAVSFGGVLLGACGSDDDDDSSESTSGTTGSAATSATTGATSAATTPGTTAGSKAMTDVGLQLSWTHSVQFGGSYLAADRGYYTTNGLNTTLSPGGPNVAGDAQTVSGQVLMNISGGDGVARTNAEGADLVIVGTQYQKSPGTLLSLPAKPIKEPKDLIGTKVGVAGADTPGLDAFAKFNGIGLDEFEKVPSQYDPAELVSGAVDSLFCFYIDLPVALEVQGVPHETLLLADFGFNPHSQTYTVRRSSLEGDERALVIELLRGEILGWQDYKTDYLEAAKLTVDTYKDSGLDLPTQEAQAKVQLDIMYSDVTDKNGFAWFTDEGVEENIKLFADLGIEGATEALWDRSLLEEIYQGKGSI